jgi:hypothetical protein
VSNTDNNFREVIVVPCNKSSKTVFNFNIYICPSKRNHTETEFFSPYVKQKVDRIAKIKYRIRQVKFKNPQSYDYSGFETSSSRFEGKAVNETDQSLINEIISDPRVSQAIETWYKSEKAWEGDKKLSDGIQLYILGDWQSLHKPLQPFDISANRFQGQRYATMNSLLTSKNLDDACFLPPLTQEKKKKIKM